MQRQPNKSRVYSPEYKKKFLSTNQMPWLKTGRRLEHPQDVHSQHTQEMTVRSTNYPGRETSIHSPETLPHNSTGRLATAKPKPTTIAGKELYMLLRL